MKKILALIVTLVLGLTACFAFTACGKDLVGFDTDLAKAVGKELGVTVEFKEINWDTKEDELSTKLIDCVWNGFTYTEARDNGYYDEERGRQIGGLDFTGFYMVNKQVAVVKKSEAANYTSNASFNGKSGCAEATSAGESVIKTVLGANPAQLEKQLDGLVAVKAGTYDYAVVDLTLASEYVANEKGAYKDSLAIVQLTGVEEEYYAVGCREGSNLPAVLNSVLKKLYANGTAQEIAKKYSLDAALYNGFENAADLGNLPTDGDVGEIVSRGKIVVGYTIFAPMSYFPE